jgi:hypothetical protein
MNAKQKRTLVLTLGIGGVLAVVLLASGKKANAKPSQQLPEGEPGSDENPIDLDAIPDEPPAPQSPGWPQPVAQTPALPAPIPAINPPGPPPQGSISVPLPSIPGVPQIPTAINVPVTLPQTADDDEPPTPANVPVPSVPVPPRPPAHTAELPTAAPQDTVTMVQRLLAQEASPNWKKADPVLQAWQKSRGLVADGKFGPGTALRVADEIGTIPLIRFWPKGTYPEGNWIRDYQAELIAKANQSPSPRKEQLLASAEREQGQGFARNVPAQKKVITLEAM